MRRVYQGGSLVCLVFSLWVVWESRLLVYYTTLGPGAGFFPFWLGLIMALLCFVWFVQVSRQAQPTAIEEGFFPGRAGALRILCILGSVVAFGLLLDIIGFQVLMFSFLLFLLLVLGRQNLVVTIVISLVGSFGVYYAFTNWLEVELPTSTIEFLMNLGL